MSEYRQLTNSIQQSVEEFCDKFEVERDIPWYVFGAEDLWTHRQMLHNEEANELEEAVYDLINALRQDDLNSELVEHVLQEMADVVYIIFQTAAIFGLDLESAIERVHRSQMTKLGNDGRPVKDEYGKVLKGPNYRKPYFGDLVEDVGV